MAINALYRAHEAGESVSDIAKVVYVSPLKALAVDIAENLDRPLDEIAAVAAELGLDAPGHPGGRPHGRHHQFAAQPHGAPATQLRRHHAGVPVPPGHERPGSQALRTVETVIVDEIHAVARDKRGAHLALTLERPRRSATGGRCASLSRRPSVRSKRSAACWSAIGPTGGGRRRAPPACSTWH